MTARKKKATEKEGKPASFEENLAELESIVRRLDGETLGVEEAMAAYETGLEALKRCRAILDAAEKRLEVLVKEENGKAATKPFVAEEAPAADSSPAAKGRKPRAKADPEDENGPREGYLF